MTWGAEKGHLLNLKEGCFMNPAHYRMVGLENAVPKTYLTFFIPPTHSGDQSPLALAEGAGPESFYTGTGAHRLVVMCLYPYLNKTPPKMPGPRLSRTRPVPWLWLSGTRPMPRPWLSRTRPGLLGRGRAWRANGVGFADFYSQKESFAIFSSGSRDSLKMLAISAKETAIEARCLDDSPPPNPP